ncbi:MAG: hypothetical protein VXX85_00825, partial [Candidatus Margulisiibacteriota bacterium]|nr:hypothetical protein [Candidatus Margulisiibacteriota bacterium]
MWWLYILLFSFKSIGTPLYQFEDSTPSNVEISGVLHPSSNTMINDTFDAEIILFNEDQSIPTLSFNESITVVDNYFRTDLELKSVLLPFVNVGKKITIRIQFDDDLFSELPFASIPTVIKSAYSSTANLMMDDDVIYFDYDTKRLGIGTVSPQATVDVVGTVNVSEYIYADGSQLTNIGYKGEDNYNYLMSENGEFTVVTVNINGDIMVGGYSKTDEFYGDLTVYGSLLVEPNENITSNMISGAGSRWMWFSARDVLRIGYVPSYYWDDEFSGDHSVAFGFATMAQGPYSVVTGGYYNQAVAERSLVGAGSQNIAYGEDSIILGGQLNVSSSNYSIILGGKENTAFTESVVLGGYKNQSMGVQSVVAGFNNLVDKDFSLVLGGKNNTVLATKSIGIGNNVVIQEAHNNSVVFGLSDSQTTSIASGNIFINAPNGVGIGTNITSSNMVNVEGLVSANFLVGDASRITNIKSEDSAWTVHSSSDPSFLVLDGRMGVATDNLPESLNVDGGIHISGEAVDVDGTIRYFNDEFSVYKSGDWVSLQMVDTNTTYNATSGLMLNEVSNTFDLVTTNAQIGQVLVWDGE